MLPAVVVLAAVADEKGELDIQLEAGQVIFGNFSFKGIDNALGIVEQIVEIAFYSLPAGGGESILILADIMIGSFGQIGYFIVPCSSPRKAFSGVS